jgi:HAD superfamily hydrolase (TIGR01509 family)
MPTDPRDTGDPLRTASGDPAGAVLFDMDGVLVDSERPLLGLLHELLRDAAVDLRPAILRQICGRPAGFLRRLLSGYLAEPERLDALLARYDVAKRELAASGAIRAFPRTVDVLALLRQRELRLAVATSTQAEAAHARLGQNGLAQWFDHVVTGDEVVRGKPEPDIFLLAAERLGVAPAACIVVEDSTAGVAAGRSAGMTVFALATTFPPDELAAAHRVFADMDELFVHVSGSPAAVWRAEGLPSP